MSVSVTALPTGDANQDILGAILLAVTAQGTGVTVGKTDMLLALDLIKQGEELDQAANP